jgi:hypothetical protein
MEEYEHAGHADEDEHGHRKLLQEDAHAGEDEHAAHAGEDEPAAHAGEDERAAHVDEDEHEQKAGAAVQTELTAASLVSPGSMTPGINLPRVTRPALVEDRQFLIRPFRQQCLMKDAQDSALKGLQLLPCSMRCTMQPG